MLLNCRGPTKSSTHQTGMVNMILPVASVARLGMVKEVEIRDMFVSDWGIRSEVLPKRRETDWVENVQRSTVYDGVELEWVRNGRHPILCQ